MGPLVLTSLIRKWTSLILEKRPGAQKRKTTARVLRTQSWSRFSFNSSWAFPPSRSPVMAICPLPSPVTVR